MDDKVTQTSTARATNQQPVSHLHALPTQTGAPRAWAIVFRGGDEVMSGLTEFVKREGIRGGHLSAIGAFSSLELGFFDRGRREYIHIPVPDQVECLSLNGTIGSVESGEPMLHVHCTVGYPDGSMKGGHVFKAIVWPTLEVFLTSLCLIQIYQFMVFHDKFVTSVSV